MTREWKCILAGGAHHGQVMVLTADAALAFPPALTMDDGLYRSMTMTSSTRDVPALAGSCVMAHSQASLQQVNEAHLLLVRS